MNWFLASLESNQPLLVVRRRFIIDTKKLKDYARSKESARSNRTCGNCGMKLYDKRRIFCNSKCRNCFNRKFRFFAITWRQVRYRTFRRDKWTCVRCGRRAREVDHKIPLAEGGKEFDVDNCQSLCRACHLQKTISENRTRNLSKLKRENSEIVFVSAS